MLLLDEPLGALDRKLRHEMQIELKQLQREVGITFIYVTHDQEEALTMSDVIVVMRDGRIQQQGHPEDLYERPVNRFVAGFIGDSNFLTGTVARARSPRRAMATVEIGSGLRLRAADRRRASPAAGDEVTVAIRPERAAVEPATDDADAEPTPGRPASWAGSARAPTSATRSSTRSTPRSRARSSCGARTPGAAAARAIGPGEPVILTGTTRPTWSS